MSKFCCIGLDVFFAGWKLTQQCWTCSRHPCCTPPLTSDPAQCIWQCGAHGKNGIAVLKSCVHCRDHIQHHFQSAANFFGHLLGGSHFHAVCTWIGILSWLTLTPCCDSRWHICNTSTRTTIPTQKRDQCITDEYVPRLLRICHLMTTVRAKA